MVADVIFWLDVANGAFKVVDWPYLIKSPVILMVLGAESFQVFVGNGQPVNEESTCSSSPPPQSMVTPPAKAVPWGPNGRITSLVAEYSRRMKSSVEETEVGLGVGHTLHSKNKRYEFCPCQTLKL